MNRYIKYSNRAELDYKININRSEERVDSLSLSVSKFLALLVYILLIYLLLTPVSKKIHKYFYTHYIKYVEVEGAFHIPEKDILDKIKNIYPDIKNTSIFLIDPRHVRDIFKSDFTRIDKMSVKVNYVGKYISIKIEEKNGFAVWIKDEKLSVLSEDGEAISNSPAQSEMDSLYILSGEGADKNISDIKLMKLNKDEVCTIDFIDSRRWDIRFKNKKTIKLPEAGMEKALKYSLALMKSRDDICDIIDSRLFPDRIFCKKCSFSKKKLK